MSGVIYALKPVIRAYGRPALLALLLHAVLLAAMLNTAFTPVASPSVAEPVISYLYQPPLPALQPQPDTPPQLSSETLNTVSDTSVSAMAQAKPQPAADNKPIVAPEPLPAALPVQQTAVAKPSASPGSPGLAQRALNRAASIEPAVVEQAAMAGYQQFLQAEQQPKITVDKRHQQLSRDPAEQVFAQLDNGMQLIRTKDGCRIADPAKNGFDALMALKTVPCGDEGNSSALLKQALEKHLKR